MKIRRITIILLVAGLLLALSVGQSFAQKPAPERVTVAPLLGTAFTYQGRLTDGGSPANGTYDFQFKLYAAASGGSQVGGAVIKSNVQVTNGFFTVQLDFGDVFNGQRRWLEIAVRHAGSGSYTILSPRQELTATPYALYSQKAPWSGLAGVPAGFADNVDNDTTYTAGTGLTLSGGAFSIATAYRLPQGCANGQVAKWNGSAWACGDDADTTYTAGTGLTLSGTQFRLNTGYTDGRYYTQDALQTSGSAQVHWGNLIRVPAGLNDGDDDTLSSLSCTKEQVAKWNGSAWECSHDNNTKYSAGIGLMLNGTRFSVNFAGSGSANTAARSDHNHWGETWTGSGASTGLTLSGGRIGLSASGTKYGVQAKSNNVDGLGVYGSAPLYGVYGDASATNGVNYGVYGRSRSTSGYGVYGVAVMSSGATYGVYGSSVSTSGTGVFGYGTSLSGENYGVYGRSNSTSGTGVYGYAYATSGTTYGVYGKSNSTSGTGVYASGRAYGVYASGGAYGVYGKSDLADGTGIYASGGYYGVYATSSNGCGVYASSSSGSRGIGVYASGEEFGVRSESDGDGGIGVLGLASSRRGNTYGVFGESASPNGIGVLGRTDDPSGYAGYFIGDVRVTGDFSAEGSKSFKIDHPLDPTHKYLYHFAQEAPQVQNVYNGVITLDANGEAVVTLPDYFSALNTGPFRYQLTPIGAPMPNLYVAQEIQGNRFRIAGGVSGKKVSWEVTAVRNDPYLRDHPVQTEVDKPAEERGTYLYPEGYGQPKEKGLDYRHNQDLFELPKPTPQTGPSEKEGG